MTRIKIDGITNSEDAKAAIAYGADAIGFIAVPGGPRYVTPAEFANLAPKLPFVQVLVVAKTPGDAREYAGWDYLQYYEDEPGVPADAPASQRRIRVFRTRGEETLAEIARYKEPVAAILLDAYHKDKLGGAGEVFNWDLAVEAKKVTDKPIILAGGLTPDNVQDALAKVRPYAVDVSSGVEAQPGRKDHAKLAAFIRAVREWDLKYGGR